MCVTAVLISPIALPFSALPLTTKPVGGQRALSRAVLLAEGLPVELLVVAVLSTGSGNQGDLGTRLLVMLVAAHSGEACSTGCRTEPVGRTRR